MVEALNTEDIINYSYVDHQPMNGLNFYRIEQVFNDESIRFSQMRQVLFEQNLSNITLFPNPASTEVSIAMPEFAGIPASIQIYDGMGQLRNSLQFDALPEEAVLIRTLDYSSGIYHVNIKLENQKMISKKLIIHRL